MRERSVVRKKNNVRDEIEDKLTLHIITKMDATAAVPTRVREATHW